MVIMLGVIVLLAAILAGVPLIFAFGLATFIMAYLLGIAPSMLMIGAYSNSISYSILCIPLFMIAAEIMVVGGVSSRLIGIAEAIMGKKLRGSLGYVMILACTFFGAISGSAMATIAAIGGSLYSQMVQKGYRKDSTAALLASAGRLGELIPPSIPAIIYGMVSGTSIAAVFLATIVPGIIMALGYCVINYFYSPKLAFSDQVEKKVNLGLGPYVKNIGRATSYGSLSLLMPVVVLGGIYGGFFTPTEAASVSAVYALLVCCFVYRTIGLKSFFVSVKHSAMVTGSLLLLMAFTVMWARILILEKVPDSIMMLVLDEIGNNKILILIFINLYLFLQGMFINEAPGIMICTPLLMPLVAQLGVHPVHFGSILLVNLGAGCMTPPVATNLFVASYVSGLPIPAFIKPSMVYVLFVMVPLILIVTYIPEISLFLPRLIMGIK